VASPGCLTHRHLNAFIQSPAVKQRRAESRKRFMGSWVLDCPVKTRLIRCAPGENRAEQQRRGRAGHAAGDVGNDHPVITGVRQRHVGDGENGVRRANDVVAVELPLIAQGRTAGLDAENSLHLRRDIQALRWSDNRGGLSSRTVSAGRNQPERQ